MESCTNKDAVGWNIRMGKKLFESQLDNILPHTVSSLYVYIYGTCLLILVKRVEAKNWGRYWSQFAQKSGVLGSRNSLSDVAHQDEICAFLYKQ